MRRVRRYTRKKKIWALLLFILFMGITVAGGMGLYYVNNFGSYLFSKKELLQTGRFENTETLERKILEDTNQIFEYAGLSQLFGESSEENTEVPLYIARINGTEYTLCLKDLANIYEALYEEQGYGSGLLTGSEEGDYTAFLDLYAEPFAEYAAGESGDEELLESLRNEWRARSSEEKEAFIKEMGWEDYFGYSWFTRIPLEKHGGDLSLSRAAGHADLRVLSAGGDLEAGGLLLSVQSGGGAFAAVL